MGNSHTKSLATAFLLFFTTFAIAAYAQNNPAARIKDATGTLNAQQIINIDNNLDEIERDYNTQIAVEIVSVTKPEPIEEYTNKQLKQWQTSDPTKGKVLIVVAKKDRKVLISTDEAFKGKLSDQDKKYIINSIIIPEFKSGRFASGIIEGMDAINDVLQGKQLAETSPFQHKNYPLLSIFVVFIILSLLSGFVKNIRIKLAVAVLVGIVFWLAFSSITYGILTLILSLFPLMGRSTRGGGGAYGGGYNEGNEGAGGNTSDSSFSLGGGTFNGGGASGDWRSFSFDTHKKFTFSDKQKNDVEQAVKDLELESSGEIVVYFGRKSDSYQQGSWKLAATLGMAGLLAVMCLSYVWMLPATLTIMAIALSIFLLMIMGFVVSYFFPAVRLAFVPLNIMDHRVITRARDIFLQEEIFNTVDRTGILIYISELEKRVQVIGDRGISSVIEQDDWNKVLALVTDGIKTGTPAEGLVEAIHECKKLLLENGFIVRVDDTNELSDEMIIEK
ncbi:MAG: TPM domain-containing protein [Cyclobacteriaceae bacterium]